MSNHRPVDEAAVYAAGVMRRLDPGALAALRRMPVEAPAPAFWKIAVARQDVMLGGSRDRWVEILRILAILTPSKLDAVNPSCRSERRIEGNVNEHASPDLSLDNRTCHDEKIPIRNLERVSDVEFWHGALFCPTFNIRNSCFL